jgi:heme a synthase
MSQARVWTHRLAWALVVVTLSMICVGAMVTSYRAGMAVPDWPTTFGHSPLLYPVRDWMASRDVFVEHGHRLLGIVLGTLTFLLAVALWRTDDRRWTGGLALAVVAVWCVQETLGGLRVLGDDVFWARIHGCVAPLFLTVVAMIAHVTGPAWVRRAQLGSLAPALPARRWAWFAVAAVYGQIVLGVQLRHLPPDSATGWFALWLWLYLAFAAVVVGLAAVLVLGRGRAGQPRQRRRAWWLAGLVVVQLALGATVWVTNFGWPRRFTRLFGPPDYTVVAEGPLQVLATTAHVVVGSLCLLVALSLALSRDERRGAWAQVSEVRRTKDEG